MAAKAKKGGRQEVVLQVPDIGLSDTQLQSLKKSFKNELVATMGEKAAALVIVIIRIRIVRAIAEI